MPTFAYRARRPGGEVLSELIEAADRPDAIARLKRQGYFLLSVEQADRSGGGRGAFRRVPRGEVAVFTGQLACLVHAGLPLAQALRCLQQQLKRTPLGEVAERLGADVSDSSSLSEAMARWPRVFPRTYTAAIRAGEESGRLAEVMRRLADNLKQEVETRGRVRGALAYPIFLCVLGAATLTVLMTFVIPRFTALFVTMGAELPAPTRILLAFSDVMDRYWPLVLGAVVAGVAAAAWAMKRQAVRTFVDAWVLRFPWVGTILQRLEMARFCRTMSELLNSGVPILSSLQITSGVLSNRQFIAGVERIRGEVARGRELSKGLEHLPIDSPLVFHMAAVGEQSGQLPEMLLEAAEIYEKQCERAIAAWTAMLGPALIVVLGGVIAFVITAILLPVFQASTLAG